MIKNKYIEKDIHSLVKNSSILKDSLASSTVLVTGATGLLGSQIIYTLLEMNNQHNKNIKILALGRDKEKFNNLFSNEDTLTFIQTDITVPIDISESIDYIFHGASVTDSQMFVQSPVDTIKVAIQGTENILKLAVEKSVKGVVYLSSLEVYGVTDPLKKDISELDYGYLDCTSVRSSYSEGKRMVECMCVAYAEQYNVPVKIARLTQTFGPGVSYNDGRVFAQFARAIIENKDITLKTEGKTVRNYCYTKDAIEAIFYILLRGKIQEAYNVANKNTDVSIRELANHFLNYSEGSKLVFDIAENAEKLGYNPVVRIRLDTTKLEKLGWKADTSLNTMIINLIADMRENRL